MKKGTPRNKNDCNSVGPGPPTQTLLSSLSVLMPASSNVNGCVMWTRAALALAFSMFPSQKVIVIIILPVMCAALCSRKACSRLWSSYAGWGGVILVPRWKVGPERQEVVNHWDS